MKNPLILSLDIGSSSVRASLFDSNADPVPRMSVKVERSFAATADGGSEMDADAAFGHVVAAIDALLERSEKLKGYIEYVAQCSFWHSVVGVNAGNKPTTKVIGWADTRSGKYAAVLKKRFDETEIHNRTGARFHSSYWPAKLTWLRKEFPGDFDKTKRWMSFSDFVSTRLFGDTTTSVSMASGTGIFDIRQCEWDGELLKFLKIKPSSLPRPAESDSAAFTLNKNYAKRWPRLSKAKWLPAIGDGAADNLGSGCVTRSQAALMVGTSGAMRVLYKGEPPADIPNGLWCYRVDRQTVVIGGALSDGGNLYSWLKTNLILPKDAEGQIARRLSAQHGLSFMPFLFGERSTGYNENAAGGVLGLTSANDTVDILQAAMESVAFRFAEILDQLNEVVKVKEIVASGGALRDSPVWTQILADVLGRDLNVSGASESSSRGAVLHALKSMGKIEYTTAEYVNCRDIIRSHPDSSKIYERQRERHRADYQNLFE